MYIFFNEKKIESGGGMSTTGVSYGWNGGREGEEKKVMWQEG